MYMKTSPPYQSLQSPFETEKKNEEKRKRERENDTIWTIHCTQSINNKNKWEKISFEIHFEIVELLGIESDVRLKSLLYAHDVLPFVSFSVWHLNLFSTGESRARKTESCDKREMETKMTMAGKQAEENKNNNNNGKKHQQSWRQRKHFEREVQTSFGLFSCFVISLPSEFCSFSFGWHRLKNLFLSFNSNKEKKKSVFYSVDFACRCRHRTAPIICCYLFCFPSFYST